MHTAMWQTQRTSGARRRRTNANRQAQHRASHAHEGVWVGPVEPGARHGAAPPGLGTWAPCTKGWWCAGCRRRPAAAHRRGRCGSLLRHCLHCCSTADLSLLCKTCAASCPRLPAPRQLAHSSCRPTRLALAWPKAERGPSPYVGPSRPSCVLWSSAISTAECPVHRPLPAAHPPAYPNS